jgi:hypothetical protein
MRRRARAVIVVLSVVGLAACGGSGSGSDSAQPSPTKAPVPSEAEAKAAVAAINLTAADMPGFEQDDSGSEEPDASPSPDPDEKAFGECLGVKDLEGADDIADDSSPDFDKGTLPSLLSISSEVEVVPDDAQARKDLTALQADKAVECMRTFAEKGINAEVGDGVTVSLSSVEKLTPAAEGTDGSFGFHLKGTISAEGGSAPLEMLVEGLLLKHTEVSLTVFGVGDGFSQAESDAAFAKLVTKAKASAV